LIVSNFINSEKLLYLDSDTIVQTDMAEILDNIPKENTFAFIGKKAELTFNNLINCTNKKIVLDFLGNDFDLNKNVIYTGTMVLNTSIIRNKFNKMVNLVKAHNETKGGIYKLFTMSIINLGMVGNIGYFDDYLKNIVDLGFKEGLEDEIEKSDVLDWSGMYKPWFCNGLYREYWMKYNIMFDKSENYVMYNKDTVETNLS
jgi:lipopolysaccharide biosynthesis glycosyltransferase